MEGTPDTHIYEWPVFSQAANSSIVIVTGRGHTTKEIELRRDHDIFLAVLGSFAELTLETNGWISQYVPCDGL